MQFLNFKQKRQYFLPYPLVAMVAVILLSGFNSLYAGNSYIIKLKNGTKINELQAKSLLEPVFDKIINPKTDNLLSSGANDLKQFYLIDDINKLTTAQFNEINLQAEFIEPNYVVKIEEDDLINDPIYASQWGLAAVRAPQAWNLATGSGIIVGVVDTGIDFEHEDLNENLFINQGEDRNGNGKFDPWLYTEQINDVYGDIDGIDNDNNGLIDDIIGFDFVDQKLANRGDATLHDGIPYDEQGHGTKVCGVIAAGSNNAIGISGLAYNAKIMTARAFDLSGNAESDDIAKAIVYLAENGAKVINCSFGENNYSKITEAAVNYAVAKGVTIVASSGNNGWAYPHFPSDLQNVISVGFARKNGENIVRNGESSWGENLSLLAPGTDIWTTNVGNTYMKAGGSSLAAPFVSAAVAMLLEKNPKLSPKEIRGILEATATPISSIERNKYEGAGLLNIEKALKYPAPVELSVSSPSEFDVFYAGKDSTITVIGTAIAPLFEQLDITLINSDIASDTTYKSVILNQQVINDTLAVFDNVGRLVRKDAEGNNRNEIDGEMTLKLTMTLKNKKTIEKNINIEILNSDEKLTIDSLSITPIYYGDKTKYLLGIRTNQKSFAKAEVYLADDKTDTKEDIDQYSRHHTLLLDNLTTNDYSVRVTAFRRGGENVTEDRQFTAEINSFEYAEFADKKYSGLPAGYMHNQVADIDRDGNTELWLCEYLYGGFDSSRVYRFNDNKFQPVEVLRDTNWLPSGFGNMYDKNTVNLLGRLHGKHAVYEVSNGKYFEKMIYSDNEYRTPWGFFDIDLDGFDEVICSSIWGIDVVKIENGKQKTIASTFATDTIDVDNTPEVLTDDFDHDGKNEIVFSDRNGGIYIYEYDNGKFRREFYSPHKDFWNVHYLEKADIDADGTPEILLLSMIDFYQEGQNHASGGSEQKTQIWKVRTYKANNENEYQEIESLEPEFYGVRVPTGGVAFKNGITAGNIDSEPGDEVLISAYPGLYCLKYSDNKLKPFHYEGNAYANAAMIYDFDGNGINEIVYSGIDTSFAIEYISESEKFLPPTDVWGWAIDSTMYFIKWIKPEGAEKVQVWLGSIYGNMPDNMLIETDLTSYILKDYEENPGIIYLKAVYPGGVSYQSKNYLFVLKNASEPLSAEYSNKSIKLTFSGKIPYNAEPDYFSIEVNGEEIHPLSVIYFGENSYLLTLENELPTGNYTLRIRSFFDYYTNPTKPKPLKFNVDKQSEQLSEMYLAKLFVRKEEFPSIELYFSENVSDDALKIENYSIEPVGSIKSIRRMSGENDAVIICFDENNGIGPGGKEYFITAKNIKNEQLNNQISSEHGCTLSFVFAEESTKNAFVYPNPIRLSRGETPVFSGVPPLGNVKIYSLDGELLRSIPEIDADGGVEWDVKDRNGNTLASGVYLFQVSDAKGNTSELIKFAVIK